MLNTFLTEVMLIAGLGALLDNVFIDKKERERIERYLETGTKDLTLNVRFSRFLERAHSILFGRFFSARLFSFSFLLSAASISVVSFSIVIGIQVYFFSDQFSEIRFDFTQCALFAAFILFNILFDYATIIQTKIFIEASLAAKSIFRAIAFIVSDLIVTMNTFIISYALFVLIVAQVFVSETNRATIILSDAPPAQEIDPSSERGLLAAYRDSEFVNRIGFWGSINAALMPAGDHDSAERTAVYYYSSFDLQDAQLQGAVLVALTSLNLTDIDLTEVQDTQELQQYSEILMETRSELRRLLDGEDERRRMFLLSFGVDGSVVKNGSVDGAYTASFYLTDQLEDGFPASLIGPMELPLLNTIIESSVASPHPGLPTAICFENGAPVSRILISRETFEILEVCQDFVAVELFWANAFDKDLALVGRDTDGYRVPFNTLLITSVLPTAFFYLAIMLLAISTVCFSKVVKSTKRVKKFFLRAPLAISGFLLGVLLSIFGVI